MGGAKPIPTPLSPRLVEAVAEARRLHEGQGRKGTSVPYLAHLLAVTALVLEHGGSEDEAIGALLHDAAEDAGGEGRLEAIREQFGEPVAEIVAGCSDTFEDPKPPWAERKQRYLDHLREPGVSESVLRVSLADKLHNARALLLDYRAVGERVFERFKTRSAADQLWYYRSLADIYRERLPGPMADQLTRVVAELEAAVGTPAT